MHESTAAAWLSLLHEAPQHIPQLTLLPDTIPKYQLWFSSLGDGKTHHQADDNNSSSSSHEDDTKWCERLAQSLQNIAMPEWKETLGKSVDELIEAKEKVKALLRKYDKTFEQRFKRPPVRHEKEPMRSLYELYRTLKSAALKSGAGPQLAKEMVKECSREQRLEKLLAEKAQLGRQLQAFADNFERRHGRKVKYARDIATVQGDYRLYKKLKQEINELRGAGFSID